MAHSPAHMKSKATSDPWAKLAERLRSRDKTPEGEGWLTMPEIIKRMGKGKTTVRQGVAAEIQAGRMEVFKGHHIKEGRRCQQFWYRMKP